MKIFNESKEIRRACDVMNRLEREDVNYHDFGYVTSCLEKNINEFEDQKILLKYFELVHDVLGF